MSSVDSLKDSALSDASSQYWEKTLTDMNNVDESFANARDLGYSRLNYSRLTAIGTLAKVDKVDIYKTNVISNRGKLSISVRTGGEDSKVLDLSTYETYLNQLKQQTDPEGYEKEKAEKKKEQAEKSSLELTAPGVRIEVYSTNRQGKQVLVADSAEDEGSELRENLELMLTGEYEASKGTYYIKISRDETVDSDEEMPYALQIKMGDTFKHDYVAIEQPSEDTNNGKESKIPLTTSSGGSLSVVNALQIQASRYQATAQMLQVGYQNMASIYSKNNKF